MEPPSPLREFESRIQKNFRLGVRASSTAFVARGARLTGHVVLGDSASVWYQAVLRGDIEPVIIGDMTNVQDAAVLHTADGLPCRIGNRCTIGHSAVVHACTVADECLIGIGAIILDGSTIGAQCIIGAGSLVTRNTQIPEGSMAYGSPARVVRSLTLEERHGIRTWAERYSILARQHRDQGLSEDGGLLSGRV